MIKIAFVIGHIIRGFCAKMPEKVIHFEYVCQQKTEIEHYIYFEQIDKYNYMQYDAIPRIIYI